MICADKKRGLVNTFFDVSTKVSCKFYTPYLTALAVKLIWTQKIMICYLENVAVLPQLTTLLFKVLHLLVPEIDFEWVRALVVWYGLYNI